MDWSRVMNRIEVSIVWLKGISAKVQLKFIPFNGEVSTHTGMV